MKWTRQPGTGMYFSDAGSINFLMGWWFARPKAHGKPAKSFKTLREAKAYCESFSNLGREERKESHE